MHNSAEELTALEMSAAELARKLEVPTNRITGHLEWAACHDGDTALRRPWRQFTKLPESVCACPPH
jgi:hypothetical protein